MALPLYQIPEQTPPDEIDEEILDIFIEEIGEVSQEIADSFDSWKNNPGDKEALQTLRRAFHTLKGSGRLVGAAVIGELGWAFEDMLNRILDGSLPRSNQVLKLIEKTAPMLPDLISQFQQGAKIDYPTHLLISQAHRLTETKGKELGEFEGAPAEAEESGAEVSAIEETEAAPVPAVELAAPEIEDQAEALAAGAEDAKAAEEQGMPPFPELESVAEAPPVGAAESLAEEDAEAVDPGLLSIYKNEANGHLNALKAFIVKCRKSPPCQASEVVLRTLHTLNGSSRSVRYLHIAELAVAIETYLRTAQEHGRMMLGNNIVALFVESGKMLESLLVNADQLRNPALYQKLMETWHSLAEALRPAHQEAIRETEQPEIAEEVVEEEVAAPAPAVKPAEPPKKVAPEVAEVSPEAADEFMDIFLDEAEEILETSQSLVVKWQASPNNLPLIKELQRELHTLKGGSRMVGISVMGDLSHQLESVLTRIAEGNAQSNPRLQAIVQESLDELAAMLEAVRSGIALEPASDLIRRIAAALKPPGEGEEEPPPPKQPKPKKTEAAQAQAEAEVKHAEARGKEAVEEKKAEPDKEASAEGGETEERIRVRAVLIDKLTNLAGELSISRAHMEQQQGALKSNLVEMEQTVMRLRDQLRRLDIETEVQILSHMRQSPHHEPSEDFDPLEMDRFSVMNQLSRSLMETVSDLVSIQDQMRNLLRHSDSLLIHQSRIGGELQDGIMRTRMVPFAQISPRLQRISRLTSRELHKQVDFRINDETIEFERTVLNRVVAPLEHMLRNAIGHGVEMPEDRQKSGKPAQATINLDLFREGTELILRLSDDGSGLNYEAIRAKAIERGMLKPDSKPSDEELSRFILEPAFSTAKTITQVSGRGVGMDIVNSEVKQLGGALQIYSERGKGTTFEIRLPLSLTINQALLVHLGEETMAVPLPNVDAVLRVPRTEVLVSSNEEVRYYRYMDHEYRIFHLGELLGFGRSEVDLPLLPMLLVRSADQRLALLVDGVEGSREVVIKPVGPQLSSIRWIAGATVLGDGRVVLILDVLTLMRINVAVLHQAIPSAAAREEKSAIPIVMVVDDSITVRKVTARLLKRQGWDVMTAKDGVDAVSQLQDRIPDIMLLDVEMPRMDGFELATQVRNDDRLKNIPIIMITSRTGMKHRERAARIGINRHLGKPFNETELLDNINELLNGKTQ